MTDSTVTVIVCAYTMKRWPVLARAVDEVQRQLRGSDELLIVIDHNEGLRGACAAEFSAARVVPNRHTRGLSGARNTGIELAQGAILVFLDDDAVPQAGWLDSLRALYARPEVTGVGGVAEPAWEGSAPTWMPDEFLWVVGCSYVGLPTDVAPVRNFIGANMSFRSSAFRTAGMFSSELGRVGTLPVGCEETEFAIRLRQVDPAALLLHQPTAKVSHVVPAARARWNYFVRRCWSEGISKATVTRLVGEQQALASERVYAREVLPRAVRRGVAAALRGDLSGASRATAVLCGLAVTVAGYVRGRLVTVSGAAAVP
ncbi:MAG: glycosyl transferase family 2, partial [Frankiales bacterium]|nr:glycosyl transferase family 2 [Frankiales bacterium]